MTETRYLLPEGIGSSTSRAHNIYLHGSPIETGPRAKFSWNFTGLYTHHKYLYSVLRPCPSGSMQFEDFVNYLALICSIRTTRPNPNTYARNHSPKCFSVIAMYNPSPSQHQKSTTSHNQGICVIVLVCNASKVGIVRNRKNVFVRRYMSE